MTECERLVLVYLSERLRVYGRAETTMRNNRYALLRFADTFGDRPLSRLGPADVERWMASRSHTSASTRRGEFSTVRLFCRWLVRHGAVHRDATRDIPAPRLPRTVPRALPGTDIATLLAACPDVRARAIVWLGVGLGLRCAEIARLEVGDWDRAGELVIVRGKGGHERALPVIDEVAWSLDRYLLDFPALSGPLIRSYNSPRCGLTAQTISGLVSGWMSAAGIKRRPGDGVSAHALRHTCASDVLDRAGGDLRPVQQMLGHSQLTSTAVYLRRASASQLREAMSGRDYRTPTGAA